MSYRGYQTPPLEHPSADQHVRIMSLWTNFTVKENVGLLVDAVDLLDANSDAYESQLVGAYNCSVGIVASYLSNPLCTDAESQSIVC